MVNMNNGGDGTSCVGDLIRKFESMCCDMDVVVRQELGHVEQQLQSFGAKVAQICSNVDKEISQILEEEKESDIDMVDSGASNIGSSNEDHYKKDSCDANNSPSSCSVQPFEKVEIESSVEQNFDGRTDENMGVTDEEIHLASKEEILASEDNLRDMLENDAGDKYMEEAESLLRECFFMDSLEYDDMIKSMLPYMPMDDLSVFLPEGILENDNEMMEVKNDLIAKQKMESNRSFEEAISDDIGETTFDSFYETMFGEICNDIDEEQTSSTLRKRRRKVGIIQSEACHQLSKEADHESKQAGHEFAVEVIQKSKESVTNPEFDCAEVMIQKLEALTTNQDSDWVIV